MNRELATEETAIGRTEFRSLFPKETPRLPMTDQTNRPNLEFETFAIGRRTRALPCRTAAHWQTPVALRLGRKSFHPGFQVGQISGPDFDNPQNLLVRLKSRRRDTMAAITESVLRT